MGPASGGGKGSGGGRSPSKRGQEGAQGEPQLAWQVRQGRCAAAQAWAQSAKTVPMDFSLSLKAYSRLLSRVTALHYN